MSLSGIWSTEVAGVFDWEHKGVLIFYDDKKLVVGGSRNYYSVGSYDESGKKVKIKLDAHFHSSEVMFGSTRKNISLVLEGERKGDEITGSIKNPKNSKQSLPVRLKKLADLP